MQKFKRLIQLLAIGSILFLFTQGVRAQQWRPVRGGINFGISGMALVEQKADALSFLIVHDNKSPAAGRIALISVQSNKFPQYFPLNWPNNTELPSDLEALTLVPGQQTMFLAATSFGQVYQFQLSADHREIKVLRIFNLPAISSEINIEGFAVQEIDGNLLAVWSNRGEGQAVGVLYWGVLDLNSYKITPQGSANLTVPWPIGNVRHISDLKVDSAGVLYICSATDNGNDGPFESAIYVAGAFSRQSNWIKFRPNSALFPLYRFNYHKIEGLELIPGAAGGLIFGTDDENMGASILYSYKEE
ncbi:MAG TPA: hypothetical protein DC064_01825 [Cyanobacteria bacterium UBA9273]|nr:hypothetical protein [Cyanobacteria bacterium UBA9273]